jgi:hypothetical protein
MPSRRRHVIVAIVETSEEVAGVSHPAETFK